MSGRRGTAGWSGIEAELRLQGWSRTRRVVAAAPSPAGDGGADAPAIPRQGDLFWTDAQMCGHGIWEFAVLATIAGSGPIGAQLAGIGRNSENAFDELKNQCRHASPRAT